MNIINMMQILREPFYLRLLRQYPNNIAHDNYKYRSVLRENFLVSRGLREEVDSHHIIPKQFKQHQTILNENFDINRSYNLVYLPNRKSSKEFPLLIHEGGHRKYNLYVLHHLNEIKKLDNFEEKRYQFWLFLKHLEKGINEKSIPWN